MMIAFITFNSSLVPLIEGLCSSNPWDFEFSGFRRNRTSCIQIQSLIPKNKATKSNGSIQMNPSEHRPLFMYMHCVLRGVVVAPMNQKLSFK